MAREWFEVESPWGPRLVRNATYREAYLGDEGDVPEWLDDDQLDETSDLYWVVYEKFERIDDIDGFDLVRVGTVAYADSAEDAVAIIAPNGASL